MSDEDWLIRLRSIQLPNQKPKARVPPSNVLSVGKKHVTPLFLLEDNRNPAQISRHLGDHLTTKQTRDLDRRVFGKKHAVERKRRPIKNTLPKAPTHTSARVSKRVRSTNRPSQRISQASVNSTPCQAQTSSGHTSTCAERPRLHKLYNLK